MQHTNDIPRSRIARVILELNAQMGYLTAEHIADVMDFSVVEAEGHLSLLCRDGFLQRREVDSLPGIYWPKTKGVRAIGRVYVPQFGTLDFGTLPSGHCSSFCSADIKTARGMRHILACGGLAAILEQCGEMTVGERFLSLAEKTLLAGLGQDARIATCTGGRKPDLATLPRRGKPTIYEVECWNHPPEEAKATYEGYRDSRHIGKVVVIAVDETAANQHRLLINKFELEHKVVLLYNDGELPTAEELRAVRS